MEQTVKYTKNTKISFDAKFNLNQIPTLKFLNIILYII